MADESNAKQKRQNTKFKPEWESNFFFAVHNGGLVCLLCEKLLNTFKKYNLERHFKFHHEAEYGQLQGPEREEKLRERKNALLAKEEPETASDGALRVSYQIALTIARKSQPFTTGDIIKESMMTAAMVLCPLETPKFESVSLSRTTIARRIQDLGRDLEEQLQLRAQNFIAFSLALDESTDVSDTAQLAIFLRGVDSNLEITEELLDLASMKDTTRSEDIFACLEESVESSGLQWDKLKSIATDGAAAMVGSKAGLVVRVQKKLQSLGIEYNLIGIHCIIHLENLCAKSIKLTQVMSVVVSTVNFLRSHGLTHRQFKNFLENLDVESEYSDIPYYCEVRWLSRGTVLQRFFQLRAEIKAFMEMKHKNIPELGDSRWIRDVAFLADITSHLNKLNTSLQGKGQMITELYDKIRGFQNMHALWERQLQVNELAHFPNVSSILNNDTPDELQEYIVILGELKGQFEERFSKISSLESEFEIFTAPFRVNVDSVPTNLQLEIIDLQCDRSLKETFRLESLPNFYKKLPQQRFPRLHSLVAKLMSMFDTTYLCERFFSLMKITKSRLRGKLTDGNLKSCLRLMSAQNIVPNIDKLIAQERCQSSSRSRASSASPGCL